MGLFTWVNHYCCDAEPVEFQSKACRDMEYGSHPLHAVPVEVARDIDGNTEQCPVCGKSYTIEIAPRDVETVPMRIVSLDEE